MSDNLKTDVNQEKAPKQNNEMVPHDDVESALKYIHLLGEGLKYELTGSMINIYSLIELLLKKGIISYQEMSSQAKITEGGIYQKMQQMPSVQIAPDVDKYTVQPVEIDCESRCTICKGICCNLVFPLSNQDLNERVLKWNYGKPYLIAKKNDGTCIHQTEDKKCGKYEKRLAICRSYDCRTDKRIWSDFENKIINPTVFESLGEK